LNRRQFLQTSASIAALSAVPGAIPRSAFGQDTYPSQDIRFICAFPPGSGADVLVRYFSNHVQKISGHTVIVENKSGAQGLLATEYVARSKPDGYTVFVHGGSGVASIPALYKNPPIDVSKTIEVVATINRQPFMLVVDAKSPYQNVAQLTEAMKKKGDKASYGVSAPNGIVMGEIYKTRTGVQAVQVDYKTANDSLNDQLSGRLDYCMHDPVYSLAQAREGRLRILGVSTNDRLQASPDLPTMSEQGVQMDVVGWWAAMVPVGVPQPVKDKLAEWFVKSVADPETKAFLNKFGGDQLQETPEQARKRFIADIDNWKEYVRIAKIEPQS
jgi:tripartite-type tricarboxylate transporter receptor subunit TctC